MRGTELHWVMGPWPGRLALAARPRGGDWLAEEMSEWQREGVSTVVSLLTPEEEHDLALDNERPDAISQGMHFTSFPIPDREVPASHTGMSKLLDELNGELEAGRNIALHCRQGIGRTGLVAACLLIGKGAEPEEAVDWLSAARGVSIPETVEQRRWLQRYAETLTQAR